MMGHALQTALDALAVTFEGRIDPIITN